MNKNFEWECKERGTFILHGERYLAYKDRHTGKIVFGRNYGCGTIVPPYTKAMKRTMLENWKHITETIEALEVN